jgi:hypothetical protein
VLFGVTWYYACESETNMCNRKAFTFSLVTLVHMKKGNVCYCLSSDNLFVHACKMVLL